MRDARTRPRPFLVALGATWVGLGLLLPPLAWLLDLPLTDGGNPLLAVVLAGFAAVLTNVSFQYFDDEDGVTYIPVGAPLVLAAIACSVAEAMAVGVVAGLLAWRPLRNAVRGVKVHMWLQGAGMWSMSIGAVALAVELRPALTSDPLDLLLTGFVATALFLVVDALSYGAWMQLEEGSGGEVLAYFRRAAPLDVGITGLCVVLSLPFLDRPAVLAAVLGAAQLALVSYYRMSTSEHRHREQAGYLRETFSRYVPESVADRLAGREEEVRLGGQSRELSVLFCDIRGFTSWSEQHDAETIIRELNVLLAGLSDAVLRHEGTLDKFTGDGLMAFWGAPLEQPDHAARACAAAADIHEALRVCNEQRVEQGMEPFAIGVGVATGEAVVGNIGHERRLDYTVIGDTVNLAARLEAATKELEVPTVISASTAAQLDDAWLALATPLGAVPVKGKFEPVRVYGLAAHAPEEPEGPAAPAAADQPAA